MNQIPTLLCRGQSIQETTLANGYNLSNGYRVGIVHAAKPKADEVLVAFVKVSMHSLPLPIFRRGTAAQREEGGKNE